MVHILDEIQSSENSIKRSSISWLFFITYLLSIVFIICSFVFMNVGQSFLIREINPEADVAASVMMLVFCDEILAILLIGIWGHLSDGFGRKKFYSCGFLLIMLSMFLCSVCSKTIFPLNFSSIFTSLLTFRLIFSFGCSMVASLMTAFISDIAPSQATGRLSGLVGISSCIGGILGAVFFPSFAIRTGYLIFSLLLLFLSIAIVTFFQDHLVSTTPTRCKSFGLKEILLITLSSSMKDRNIFLSYLNSIVSRSVSMINTTLLEIWVASHLILAPGITPKTTVIRLNGILQGTSLIMAPVFGILSARISPTFATLSASMLGILGDSLLVYFIQDPLSKAQYGVMFLKGSAQIGLIVSGMALASRHSPPELRGAVSGAYGFFGAFGIILNSQIAKHVGSYSSSNPFILLLCWETVLFICSFIVFISNRSTMFNGHTRACNITI